MELSQDSGVSSPERRSEKRRKSRVNKLVYAGVRLGEQETRDFLYLVDISTGGMRVNLPRLYEVESRICLSMPTEPYLGHGSPELVAECRVAWNRSILGGTYVHGLEFQELAKGSRDIVEQLFDAFSPEGRRYRFRLNRVLNISFFEDEAWVPWMACDISPEGLGIQTGDLFPLEEIRRFRIFLEDHSPHAFVEVAGQVTHITELDDSLLHIGIKFVDIDREAAKRISKYIDKNSR